MVTKVKPRPCSEPAYSLGSEEEESYAAPFACSVQRYQNDVWTENCVLEGTRRSGGIRGPS